MIDLAHPPAAPVWWFARGRKGNSSCWILARLFVEAREVAALELAHDGGFSALFVVGSGSTGPQL